MRDEEMIVDINLDCVMLYYVMYLSSCIEESLENNDKGENYMFL